MFLASGWHPGRRVTVRFDRVENLRPFPLAAELLAAFGGLCVGVTGPGRDCATSDIEFTSCSSANDRYAVDKRESSGDDLFPLGQAHRRHLELFLDSQGRLIAFCVPNGKLVVVGESFGDGIERLLLGYTWPKQGHSGRPR
jgi:hypothetical protein